METIEQQQNTKTMIPRHETKHNENTTWKQLKQIKPIQCEHNMITKTMRTQHGKT